MYLIKCLGEKGSEGANKSNDPVTSDPAQSHIHLKHKEQEAEYAWSFGFIPSSTKPQRLHDVTRTPHMVNYSAILECLFLCSSLDLSYPPQVVYLTSHLLETRLRKEVSIHLPVHPLSSTLSHQLALLLLISDHNLFFNRCYLQSYDVPFNQFLTFF